MGATGLDVLDQTIHITDNWLCEITDRLDRDRLLAWTVLSAVLHKLRDRLPTDLSAHSKEAVATVFAELTHHFDPGMIEKSRPALSAGIRNLWRKPFGAEAE
ncbi:MAG TPA: hypothetical protein VFO69_09450 [Allosphingosinicella sp.]|nr:hypothetical protein [Allosphingosinicella sp.]